MKLIELIEAINQEKTDLFLTSNSIDIEYDLIDIYSRGKLNIKSEIFFFNAEKIPNEILIKIEEVEYQNICPLNMLEDIVSDLKIQKKYIDSVELTKKVIEYLANDA